MCRYMKYELQQNEVTNRNGTRFHTNLKQSSKLVWGKNCGLFKSALKAIHYLTIKHASVYIVMEYIWAELYGKPNETHFLHIHSDFGIFFLFQFYLYVFAVVLNGVYLCYNPVFKRWSVYLHFCQNFLASISQTIIYEQLFNVQYSTVVVVTRCSLLAFERNKTSFIYWQNGTQ